MDYGDIECAGRRAHGLRYWIRISGVNTLAAVAVVVVFSGVTTRTPIAELLETFAIALLFANCIGPLLAILMPFISPAIWRRFAFPVNWIVSAATMVVLATVGSAIALSILVLSRVIPGSQFSQWFAGSFKVSVVITLTFGISTTAVELMRSRLDQATVALRTKERDEAHARQLAAEAQLASLESRVHPHFLFNTLNSISALIPQDPHVAEQVVGRLASLLRFSLETEPLVALDRELRVVRDYLEIERVRFGERLRYRVDVDPRTLDALVPRLSIQTLVENSVKYAVSPRREGASIIITARTTEDALMVSVADDGPGFEDALPPGHGLALLRARLLAQFDDRASLSIDRTPSLPGPEPDRAARPDESRSTGPAVGAALWTRATLDVPLRVGAPVR